MWRKAELAHRGLEDEADTFRSSPEGTGAEQSFQVGEYHQQMHVSRKAFLQQGRLQEHLAVAG